MKNEEIVIALETWAKSRNIASESNKLQQLAKTMEELGELASAVLKNNKEGIVDAVGDVQVCLIILCLQLGLDYNECLNSAYQEIKNRTGKTVNGTFIKD